MLYRLLCVFGRFALRRYFRQIQITHSCPDEQLSGDETAQLIVANHPSVILDALLIAYHYSEPIWFVIRGSLFRGYLRNYLFKALHYLPIHQREGSPQAPKRSETSFAQLSAKLQSNSSILIFPEGRSQAERTLLRIKTGAARCAFQAEKDAGFALGLRIQPVGITYADFLRKQSTVTLNFGAPIKVSDYRQEYQADPEKAVRSLTETIGDSLISLIAEVHDLRYGSLVDSLSKIYQSKDSRGIDDWMRMKQLAKDVELIERCHPSGLEEIEQKASFCLGLADNYGLDASQSLEIEGNRLFLTIIGPLISLASAILYPVKRLISLLTNRLARDDAQVSSYQFALGFFLVPFYCSALAVATYLFSNSLLFALCFLLALTLSAYLSNLHTQQFRLFLFSLLFSKPRNPALLLQKARDQVIEDFELLKNECETSSLRAIRFNEN